MEISTQWKAQFVLKVALINPHTEITAAAVVSQTTAEEHVIFVCENICLCLNLIAESRPSGPIYPGVPGVSQL